MWCLARRDGARLSDSIAVLGISAVAAVVGARVWAFLEWWSVDRTAHWIWNPFEPAGYSSSGAFVGGGLALIAARAIFGRASFKRAVDVVIPAAFISLAFARLGCLFEGCDIGSATTGFGVIYPTASSPVHAFALYIAVPTLFAALAVGLMHARPGLRAVTMVFAYAVIRFGAEFFRAGTGVPSLGHLLALALAAVAVAWWGLDRAADEPSG